MLCPNCECLMDSMGYGDEVCPKCKHISYSESDEEFNNRVYGKDSFSDLPESVEPTKTEN